MARDRERLAEVRRHVAKVVQLYIERRGFGPQEIRVSQWLLNMAIESAMIDIERMSQFHIPDGRTPDRHKYAGFTARWIAKTRPIQFLNEFPLNLHSQHKIWANAELALTIFESFLVRPVPDKMVAPLKYAFMFREERGESLALIAYCCEEMP